MGEQGRATAPPWQGGDGEKNDRVMPMNSSALEPKTTTEIVDQS
eukprot:CAMPEP_0176191766 /NCGR_PEP_ID=MMETSP0121_2-20121125/4626_1 /TAXON_ID=160619 /ORGANISM="Kryptoperidinium foliaceum, Strain CCMP 1326" /LENGTH=43 /DNA_ID= /DNA_START= /DNA_END= /DNA_ORIENTATION=